MRHFGVTPLAYAACFGHYDAFKTLFGDAHSHNGLLHPERDKSEREVIINGNRGNNPALRADGRGQNGYYPLHAVVACGRTEMYDLLVNTCGAKSLRENDCPTADVEWLTPLQLAAKLGNKKMFKHILKSRTKREWQWGPVSKHWIPLDEIDSADSKGHMTVMELLVHPQAKKEAREFLLEDFLHGFLYKLYKDKWYKDRRKKIRATRYTGLWSILRTHATHYTGLWFIFIVRLFVLSVYVMLLSFIASPSIVRPFPFLKNASHYMRGFLIVELILITIVASMELVESVFIDFCNKEVCHEKATAAGCGATCSHTCPCATISATGR